MSEYIVTYGIRARISQLNDADQATALEFFRPLLGEPEELYEQNGQVESFYYEVTKGFGDNEVRQREYEAVREFNYENNSQSGWGIQKMFVSGRQEEITEAYLSIGFIQEEAQKMAEKFGLDISDIFVYSYTWYNGVDEPKVLDANDPKIKIEVGE